jgi:type VI secretion system protein ImpL
MAKYLWKAVKIFLILVLLVAAGIGLYLLTQFMKWPWWVAVVIYIGLLGLILGLLFLRKYLLRRREKRFVERVIQHDEAIISKKPVGERQQLRDLQEKWKAAVDALRQSHLKSRGNPLYVLPWYIILGESGSGKTTAIRSARLHSPMTDVSPAAGISGTRNCDWWFFDDAVILDTAGRYTVPVDEGADREEWQRFLGLLAKYRKREPLNGAVVTVAADKLIAGPNDKLAEEARNVRRRLDELMRVVGARFPIWILVTKMDQVLGLTALGDLLPADVLNQAMGDVNVALRDDPGEMVETTVEATAERLKDIRLFLMEKHGLSDPALLLFPEETQRLKPALAQFVNVVFSEDSFLETPLMRGIYFSSGRQDGRAYSQIIGALDAFKEQRVELPPDDRGLFLKEFFGRIIPGDRDLFAPLQEFMVWRRATRGFGLLAWVAIWVCVLGLLTLSYMKNLDVIADFTDDILQPPTLSQDLGNDLIILSSLNEQLLEMESMNHHWWVPRLGLDQSLHAEEAIKKRYCTMFRKGFLDSLDTILESRMDSMTPKNTGAEVAAFVAHLTTRVNLIKAQLNGATAGQMRKMPPPSYQALLAAEPGMISNVASQFSLLYIYYLDWYPDPRELVKKKTELSGYLEKMVDLRGRTPTWLVDWANTEPELSPVTQDEFWGSGRLDYAAKAQVPAAYTKAGMEAINRFIVQVASALGQSEWNTADFDAWYRREYFQAWSDFGWKFDQGYTLLADATDRRELAEGMSDKNNPYFLLLERMAVDLAPMAGKGAPPWVEGVLTFKDVRTQASHTALLKSGGVLAKAAEKGETLVRGVVGKQDDEALKHLTSVARAAEKVGDYDKALTKVIPVTSSREMAFKMASQFFPNNSEDATAEGKESQQSPFHDAAAALTQIETSVGVRGTPADNVFLRLLYGPLNYLLSYMTYEAACELQNQWEGEVLASAKDMPPKKLEQELFAKDQGIVWKFVQGPAASFIGRREQGFYARKCLEQSFPFTDSFLIFLDRGASEEAMVLPEYEVTIHNRPTDVNRGARMEPHGTELTLECESGAQVLENLNYPGSLAFKWKPKECGTVTLKILFDDFQLVDRYEGPNGFPWFLESFYDGVMLYTPFDFPDHRKELEAMGITEIRVSYVIQGSRPVRTLLGTKQRYLPAAIVKCLDQ